MYKAISDPSLDLVLLLAVPGRTLSLEGTDFAMLTCTPFSLATVVHALAKSVSTGQKEEF